MHLFRQLLPCTLALGVFFAAPVRAQQSFVTMRTSLRTDLTPEALAAEAFEASKRIETDAEGRANALREVTIALEFVGRIEEARILLVQAIEAAKVDEPRYKLPWTVPIHARLHGPERAAKFLATIKDPDTRTQAGIKWVQDALKGDDERNLAQAAAALHSYFYTGWDTDADAQLSVAYRRLGNM